MRFMMIATLLLVGGCAGSQPPAAVPPQPRVVSADTIVPVHGAYLRDCLTPPDSTGACVLRDQRVRIFEDRTP